jgi:hypothetical protein
MSLLLLHNLIAHFDLHNIKLLKPNVAISILIFKIIIMLKFNTILTNYHTYSIFKDNKKTHVILMNTMFLIQ